ncbi:MAG: nitroreductase/dihydropteridine reductase [Candidatus Paceibacteria bacterium]|jgi:nitroreductase/dihydropteridine reductase
MTSEILKQLHWRYACKKFDATYTLSQEKLALLKESFNLTATSYGLQPLKMVVISDPKIKEDLVSRTMNQTQVKDCSHLIVLCTETNMDAAFIEGYFQNVQQIRNTPEKVLAPFKAFLMADFKSKSSETKDMWMAKQAYIALGNLLTVCAIEQIDACPIEGFDTVQYDSYLNLTEIGLRSVLLLAVGQRDQNDIFASMPKVRRGVDEVVIEL